MVEEQGIEKLFDAKLAHILDLNEAQSKDIGEIKGTLNGLFHDCRIRHEGVDHEIAEIKAVQAFKDGKCQAAYDLSHATIAKIGLVVAALTGLATFLQWLVLKG